VPSEYIAEAVVAEFPDDLVGKRILIPRAKDARDELPNGFAERGAEVHVSCVYETVTDTSCAAALQARLQEGDVDVVTFTSASTVRSFLALVRDATLPDHTLIACIGPITADCAREHGLHPAVVAEEYTIEGLVDALVAHSAGSCT